MNQEKYSKFYDIMNNIIIFFIMNTYETNLKNLNGNLEKINELSLNIDYIENTLKLQLNICWNEFNKISSTNNNSIENKNKDQLIKDLNDLINLNIIDHKICLFIIIKGYCISIINSISKIDFSNIKDEKEYIEKIAKLTNAIMIINKTSSENSNNKNNQEENNKDDKDDDKDDDDELDDFSCIDCNYDSSEMYEIFWK